MCSCHSILECCVTFSGVKLSIRSFVLFADISIVFKVNDLGSGLVHNPSSIYNNKYYKNQ